MKPWDEATEKHSENIHIATVVNWSAGHGSKI